MARKATYRRLRRWIWPVLLVALPASACLTGVVAAFTVLVVSPFGAAVIAMGGMVAVFGSAFTLVVGVFGALWGLMRCRSSTVKGFGARPLEDHRANRIARELADTIGMPRPTVYSYPSEDINAWATGSGPGNAAIGVSSAALQRLDDDVLAALIGHELGHIASGDMTRMQMAISFQKSIVWFAWFVAGRNIARNTLGLPGEIAVKWLSRRREYWADAVGAALSSPEAMIALFRIVEADNVPKAYKARLSLLFNWNHRWLGLFRTHPSINQRCHAIAHKRFYPNVLRRLELVNAPPLQVLPSPQAEPASAPAPHATDVPYVPALPRRPRRRRRHLATGFGQLSDAQAVVSIYIVVTPISFFLSLNFLFNEPEERVLIADPAPAPAPQAGPKVAGWTSTVRPEPKPVAAPNVASPSPPPLDRFPDGAGSGCIDKFMKDENPERRKGRGPGGSTLVIMKRPIDEPRVGDSLFLFGIAIRNCWGNYGAFQERTDINEQIKHGYDVWTFPGGDGADLECGVFAQPRRVSPIHAGMGAYCREMPLQ